MTTDKSSMLASLIDAYLACDMAARPQWLIDHHDQINLEFIDELKNRSDKLLQSNGTETDSITQAALQAAATIDHIALAMPLAQWARGNWATYNALNQALDLYTSALDTYRKADEHTAATRILGNMVGVMAEFGRYEEAERYYHEASAIYTALDNVVSAPRMILEQNYGLILHEWGRYEQALLVHEQAYQMAVQLNHEISIVHTRVNYAFTLERLGRLDEALTTFSEFRDAAAHHGLWLVVARIDMNLGNLYAHMGNPADAIRCLQSAYDGFNAQNNHMELGSVLLRLAGAYARVGAFGEAIQLYKQAEHHFLTYNMLPQVGEALLRAARASKHHRSFTQAHQLLDQADDLWESLSQPILLTLVRLERVALTLAQQKPDQALRYLQQISVLNDNPLLQAEYRLLHAHTHRLLWIHDKDRTHANSAEQDYKQVIKYAERQHDRWSQRQALIGLGLLWENQDGATAITYFEQAAAIEQDMLQAFSIEELKSSFQRQSKEVYTPLIRLALKLASAKMALHYVWQEKGGGLHELLSVTRSADKTPLDHEIEQIRHTLASYRWEVARRTADDTVEALQEREDARMQELEQQLSRLRQKRNIHHINPASSLFRNPTLIFDQTTADIIIEYAQCDDEIIAIRLDRSGTCTAINLGSKWEISRCLDDLEFGFGRVLRDVPAFLSQETRSRTNTYLTPLSRLYDLLIRPVGTIAPATHILIAPCAPLHLTPFAALWNGSHFFGEEHLVEMTPCAVILRAPRSQALKLTDPILIGASREGLLPNIATEIVAISSRMTDAAVLIDNGADVEVLSNSNSPRLLHIGAHTIIRDDAPIFSALDLKGGLLSVEHCYSLNLQGTPLVTLSGCITTKGWDTGGAILAFPSAFFIAGATRVVSSLWNTYDRAAVKWMEFFYEHYGAFADAPAATQEAQQRMREETEFNHPALWGAFICSRR